MPEPTIKIDVTPGKHSFMDALAIVSFKLGCGCNVRPSKFEDAFRPVELKNAGQTYPCDHHGDQVITRATTRLVGWRDSPPPGWRPEV